MSDQYDPGSTEETINGYIKYSGKGGELALLMFKNLILTILTLGIYSAWGRTNTRRYIWGNFSFLGDRAAYTGTGKELFRGWVMIVLLYVIAMVVFNIGYSFFPTIIKPALGLLLIPLYIYFYCLIVYGGTRFRLGRTKWRETYFGLERDDQLMREFVWLVVKGVFLSVITLGLYAPKYLNDKRKFIINKASFGTSKFHFSGSDREYYGIILKGIFLSLITLGIYSFWFFVDLTKYKIRNITFDKNMKFELELNTRDFIFYAIIAYLGTIFTIGLALPWIINEGFHLFANATKISGTIDFNSIQNVEQSGNAIADVAATEYDFDLGF